MSFLISLKRFIAEIFQDRNGDFSSKRYVTIISANLIILGFVVDLFTDLTVSQFMYESLMYITIAGLGFTGAEQFARNKTSIGGDSL